MYRAERKADTNGERLWNHDLLISENALEREHRSVGASLNNLAALYKSQDRYNGAEILFRRSRQIWEKALAPDNLMQVPRHEAPVRRVRISYAVEPKGLNRILKDDD